MADKILNTRIQSKYDSYDNWFASTSALLKGEIAIATIAVATEGENSTNPTQNTPPAIVIKVGDGVNLYKDLPFASALAADVYPWAKAATKPTYEADEIDGLADYIAGEIEDTDTQYQIVQVNDTSFKLQSKALNGDWTDVTNGVIDISSVITGLDDRIALIEALNISANYATKEEVNTLETTINDTLENYATKEDAQGYADAKDDAIAAAQTSADNANELAETIQTDLDNYKDTVSTTYETKEDASSKLTEAKTYAKGLVDALIDGASDTTLDSIKELSDAIKNNDSAIDALNDIAGTKANASDLEDLSQTVENNANITAATFEDISNQLNDTMDFTESIRTNLETEIAKKTNDIDLAAIAKSGSTDDLIQGELTLIFNCGDSKF